MKQIGRDAIRLTLTHVRQVHPTDMCVTLCRLPPVATRLFNHDPASEEYEYHFELIDSNCRYYHWCYEARFLKMA